MYSREPRHIYPQNPLAEVICQLRFPDILDISANPPAAFQEAIRSEFPIYDKKNTPIPGLPVNGVMPTEVNHQFSTEDGSYRINLSGKFIAITCHKYTCWEDFANRFDKPLFSFISQYKPVFFNRVGLRYVNLISRRDLNLENYRFKDLIAPCYLGILSEDDMLEQNTTRCATDTEFGVRGGGRCRIHAGPGMLQRPGAVPGADKELKFIFDLDLYTIGKIPASATVGAMSTLHAQAFPLFRGAITDILNDRLMDE